MAHTRLASAGGTGTFAPNAALLPLAICFRIGLMSRVGFYRGPFRPIDPRNVPASTGNFSHAMPYREDLPRFLSGGREGAYRA